MALKIVSVGFNFALEDVVDVELSSNIALADADVILFTPSFDAYFSEDEVFSNGEHFMSAGEAARLRAKIQHWRTELVHAVNAGKTVICLFEAPRQFRVETGRTYSGTGKSRVPSLSTAYVRNYEAFPVRLEGVTASTSSALSATRTAGPFAQLWKEVAQHFEAQAYFTAPDGTALLEITDGSKRVVAASFAAAKNLFLLPDIRLPTVAHTSSGNWSQRGLQCVQTIKSFAVNLHKARQSDEDVEPDWVKESEFSFGVEAIGAAQIEIFKKQQAALDEKIKEIENSIHPVTALRRLLFASGPKLESAVRSAFETLGFSVTTYSDEEREIDLILEFDGHRFVGEVEGKETKPVDVNKLSQLERIMAEDYERPDVSEYARGLLIGNSSRNKRPQEREATFTAKVLQAAERRGIVLIDTVDLFRACRAVINGSDGDRKRVRDVIVAASGGLVVLAVNEVAPEAE